MYTEQRIWRAVYSMHRILYETLVQSGGSHGVALLSHRQDTLPLCTSDSLQTRIYHAPAQADLRVCVTRGTTKRDNVSLLPCETNLLSLWSAEKPKMDVTECYTAWKIISTFWDWQFRRCRKLGMKRLTNGKWIHRKRKDGITVTANFDACSSGIYIVILTSFIIYYLVKIFDSCPKMDIPFASKCGHKIDLKNLLL